MAYALNREIPKHVPPELVVTLPLFSRTVVYENPHEVMIPEMHNTLPSICYGAHIFPGDQQAWLLMRAEDMHDLLRDAENFTKNGMAKFAQSIGDNWLSIPTETDPPAHGHYRKAMNPYFSASRMLALKDQLRQRARALIEKFEKRGECDFIKEFSEKFPIYIVLDMLGLPQDRMEQFLAWEKEMIHGNDWEERARSIRNVKEYLLDEIDKRRQKPGDDYISHILQYEYEDRKWTSEEVLGHCFNLYIGGLDTVTSTLGNFFRFLAANPKHQNELRDEPGKIPAAIEELFRAYGTVSVFRVAKKQVVIRGQTIMPGDYVTVSTSIVGRDPTFYEAANEVRFDRKPKHIALGDGIHRCLGQHLARLELQVAFEEFLKALPTFRVKDGMRLPYFAGGVLHLKELHLQWN